MRLQAAAQEMLRAGNPTATSVSVAADGSVWAVDADGAIVHATEAVEAWTTVAGSASFLALTAESLVLAVMQGRIVAHPRSVEGSWEALSLPPFQAASLAIQAGSEPSQDTLWALDVGRRLWTREANDGWETAGVTADVLAATTDGALYRLDAGALSVLDPSTPPWVSIETPESLTDVSAGATGFVWGVEGSGSVYQWDGGSTWERISAPTSAIPTAISVGEDATVWLLSDGTIWQYVPAEGGWSAIGWEADAAPAQIALANLEAIWVLDVDGGIHCYTADAAEWVPLRADGLPRFEQVAAVEARELWTLDAAGRIAALREADGVWQSTRTYGEGWMAVGASADAVLALDDAGDSYELLADGEWRPRSTTPPLKGVAVGGTYAVAIADGQVVGFDRDGKAGWTTVEPPLAEAAVDVSVMPGGSIWAVTATGRLFWYLGTWIAVSSPPLTQVAAGGDAVWGIEADGVVVDLGGDTPLGEVPRSRRRAGGLPQWDAEEPFDEAQSTHLWIVNRAARLAQGQGATGQAICALVKPGQGRIGDLFHDNLCQGLYDADWKPEFNQPVLEEPTYASHFYDAEGGENWLHQTSPTAVTQGSLYFSSALLAHQQGRPDAAGYALGLSLHYFTDLTQPMHAANFTWLSSHPRWGYHTAFEAYVMEIQSTVQLPTSYVATARQTPEQLLIGASSASKQHYYDAICPWWAVLNYYRFTSYYKGIARKQAPLILRAAIRRTAQYLVQWMESAGPSA